MRASERARRACHGFPADAREKDGRHAEQKQFGIELH
jgi:hypothetical protein